MEKAVDQMLNIAAQNQGIKTRTKFYAWWQQQKHRNLTHLCAELDRHLLTLAGDDWLFDRALVEGNS